MIFILVFAAELSSCAGVEFYAWLPKFTARLGFLFSLHWIGMDVPRQFTGERKRVEKMSVNGQRVLSLAHEQNGSTLMMEVTLLWQCRSTKDSLRAKLLRYGED
jgi:hypothetical protein